MNMKWIGLIIALIVVVGIIIAVSMYMKAQREKSQNELAIALASKGTVPSKFDNWTTIISSVGGMAAAGANAYAANQANKA